MQEPAMATEDATNAFRTPLPVEMLQAIFKQYEAIHSPSLEDWARLSLCSKLFHALLAPKIFSRLNTDQLRSPQGIQIMTDKPGYKRYVTTAIWDVFEKDCGDKETTRSSAQVQLQRKAEHDQSAQLLSALVNLRHLTVNVHYLYADLSIELPSLAQVQQAIPRDLQFLSFSVNNPANFDILSVNEDLACRNLLDQCIKVGKPKNLLFPQYLGSNYQWWTISNYLATRSSVQRLELVRGTYELPSDVLGIRHPALQELVLGYDGIDGPGPVQGICAFLVPCSLMKSLRVLKLNSVTLRSESNVISSLSAACPQLRELHLSLQDVEPQNWALHQNTNETTTALLQIFPFNSPPEHLQTLHIRFGNVIRSGHPYADLAQVFRHFLNRLVFPRLTSLQLQCILEEMLDSTPPSASPLSITSIVSVDQYSPSDQHFAALAGDIPHGLNVELQVTDRKRGSAAFQVSMYRFAGLGQVEVTRSEW